MALVLLVAFEEELGPPPDFLTRNGETTDVHDPARSERSAALGDGRISSNAPAGAGPAHAEASLAAGASGDRPPCRAPDPGAGARDHGATAPRARHRRAPARRQRGAALQALDGRLAAMPQFQIPELAVFAVIALAMVGVLAYIYIPGSLKAEPRGRLYDGRRGRARSQRASPGDERRRPQAPTARRRARRISRRPRRSTRTTRTSCRCRPMLRPRSGARRRLRDQGLHDGRRSRRSS